MLPRIYSKIVFDHYALILIISILKEPNKYPTPTATITNLNWSAQLKYVSSGK